MLDRNFSQPVLDLGVQFMRLEYLSLRIHKGCALPICFFLMLTIQGCAIVTCPSCRDKTSDGKECGTPTAVVLTCKDSSIPRDGMCSNGEDAVPADEVIPQACMQKPASCGSKCYAWQEGKTGCDTSNPAAKCTSYTYSNGSCKCRCM